jgi:hypothetical protein
MSDERKQEEELTEEELEQQDGELLPDREAMSVVTTPGDPGGYEIGSPPPTE